SAYGQINARERNAARQVLMAEDDHLPEGLRDAERLVERLEVAHLVVVRQFFEHVRGVDAAARVVDRALVEVCGENLDAPFGKLRAERVRQKERQRVRLLARCAPGRPEAKDVSLIAPQRYKLRHHALAYELEGFGVAEEARDLDEKCAYEFMHLFGVSVEVSLVL